MERELPDKYKTCDWLWNYGSIGLTKEHIKRLNNAINILESLNEHTDTKYLKEIKDKLLEDKPEIYKTNTDAFIEKAEKWLEENVMRYLITTIHAGTDVPDIKDAFFDDFKNYMKGE